MNFKLLSYFEFVAAEVREKSKAGEHFKNNYLD